MFRKQKLLYGWMAREKVVDYLMQCSKPDQERLDGILASWSKAVDKRAVILKNEAGLADQISVSDLPGSFAEKLDFLQNQAVFKNSFRNQTVEFKLIEIDKLVTHTVFVYQDYVDKLLAKLSPKPGLGELLDFCLPLTKEPEASSRLRLDQFNYVYSSESPDFRLIDVIAKPANELDLSGIAEGVPVRAIIILMGFGFPMVKAVRVGKRLVLDNGFHRLYALRCLGVTHVPAVVTNDAANVSKYLPLDFIANSSRPPLFKDFFDPDLTTEVSKQKSKRAVKVSIVPEVLDVPA